jgi:hypothetical protein
MHLLTDRVLAAFAVTLPLFLSSCSAAAGDDRPSRTPDCVYVGTPYDVATRMADIARPKKSDLVCDPGCCDGRVLITAARRYGCRGTGYELDPRLAKEAMRSAKNRGVGDLVTVEVKDIFTVDYSNYDVVLMYLLPDMVLRLLPELEQLKRGARIVAHDYGIDGIEPDRRVSFISNEDNVEHTVYLYTVPLKKAE